MDLTANTLGSVRQFETRHIGQVALQRNKGKIGQHPIKGCVLGRYIRRVNRIVGEVRRLARNLQPGFHAPAIPVAIYNRPRIVGPKRCREHEGAAKRKQKNDRSSSWRLRSGNMETPCFSHRTPDEILSIRKHQSLGLDDKPLVDRNVFEQTAEKKLSVNAKIQT